VRILVAGGAGYVGSAVVPRLIGRGYDVTVVDLLWFGDHLPAGVEIRRANVLELTAGDLVGFDQVIFLAGLSNDPMAEYSPAQNFIYNAASPAYLAFIAKKAGVRRFIYASSCSVYGHTGDQLHDETMPAVSTYPYGISKLQGEHGVLQLADESFSVIALRKGTVCGYSPRMRLDLVINTMFRTAVESRRIVVSNPAIWRPILGINDAASAYVRAVEAAADKAGVFNVASANFTLGQLADDVRAALREVMELEVDLHIEHRDDVRNYRVSTEKIERDLGFEARDTVLSLISELASHLHLFRDFGDPMFHNIERLQQVMPQTVFTVRTG
jgi:nucleoside-diphosphate-sugar epimerase